MRLSRCGLILGPAAGPVKACRDIPLSQVAPGKLRIPSLRPAVAAAPREADLDRRVGREPLLGLGVGRRPAVDENLARAPRQAPEETLGRGPGAVAEDRADEGLPRPHPELDRLAAAAPTFSGSAPARLSAPPPAIPLAGGARLSAPATTWGRRGPPTWGAATGAGCFTFRIE